MGPPPDVDGEASFISAPPSWTVHNKSMFGTQSNSNLPSAPSYGFGTSERPKGTYSKVFVSEQHAQEKKGAITPGPVYKPRPTQGWMGDAPLYTFGASHRYQTGYDKPQGPLNTPGPGQYVAPSAMAYQASSVKPSLPSWKFGTGAREDQAKVYVSAEHSKTSPEFIQSPGPSAYDSYSGMGIQVDARKRSADHHRFGTAERFNYGTYAKKNWLESSKRPGPGSYKNTVATGPQTHSQRASLPAYSFGRAERDQMEASVYITPNHERARLNKGSPGPSVMQQRSSVGSQVSSRQRTAPSHGFGSADRFGYVHRANKAMLTPGPGSYSM